MLFHTSVLSVLILIFFQESVWIRKFIIQNCPMSVSDIQILNLKCPLPYMSLFYWVPASLAQWQSVGLVNQRSWVQSSLEAHQHFDVHSQECCSKKILTPTWFEHAAFWSGVRRATVAPRSQVWKGSTEIWTRIAGFKVQSANHYTMGPSYQMFWKPRTN